MFGAVRLPETVAVLSMKVGTLALRIRLPLDVWAASTAPVGKGTFGKVWL